MNLNSVTGSSHVRDGSSLGPIVEGASRNFSGAKVKRSANISLLGNIQMIIQSKQASKKPVNTSVIGSGAGLQVPQGSGDLSQKQRSVSRSFSRRRYHTNETHNQNATVDTGSINTSQGPFNSGSGKNHRKVASGGLYGNRSRVRDASSSSYFGLRGIVKAAGSSGKKDQSSTKYANPSNYISKYPDSKEIMELKRLYDLKDFQTVISTAQAYLESQPVLDSDPNLHYLVGMSHYKLESYHEAKLSFEKLICLKDKYKKSIYLFLAVCLNHLKDFEGVIAILGRANSLFPKYYEAKVARCPNS